MKMRFPVNTWLHRRSKIKYRKRRKESAAPPRQYGRLPSATSSDNEQSCLSLEKYHGMSDARVESSSEKVAKPQKAYDHSLPLPPLLALPLELQQEIIEMLVNSSDPGLADLRGASRYLYSIVTPAELHRHGLVLLDRRFLKKADRLFAFLKLDNKLPCSLCQVLRPISDFHWKSRQKDLGSKRGHTRFCMDCGIKHGRFGGGNSIKVDNTGDNYRIVCSECLEFLDQPPRFEDCYEHHHRWYLRGRDDRVY